MKLYSDIYGVTDEVRRQRIPELLAMTGLAPFTERLAGRLSGGMKQKLGLACTLTRMPSLLLLDEPSVGVDPLSRRELWAIIKKVVAQEHMTVLVSTGYMEDAEACDKVCVIDHGRVLAEGTPTELLRYAEHTCYRTAVPEGIQPRVLQAALMDDRENVLDAVPEGIEVRFNLRRGRTPDALTARQFFPQLAPYPVPTRLEDSFMYLLHQAAGSEDGGQEYAPLPSLPASCEGRNRIGTAGAAPVAEHGDIDIEVHDLVRRFGNFTAVNETSFAVHHGEVFGLLGPNGAGKTTTFRMLCGLLPATSGQLLVAGKNLRTAPSDARRHIGYVAQKFSLYSMLSVRENLEFFGGAYGLSRRELADRIPEVLEEFALTDRQDALAGSLPLGYKQRLSMAAALLHRPRILFLDEATSGIDPIARRGFWRRITSLAAAGTTVVITTHFMEEANYCDRIMIQDQGRMIAIGTPAEVMRQGHAQQMNEAFINIVEAGRAADDYDPFAVKKKEGSGDAEP